LEPSIDFNRVAKKVFNQDGHDIFIGGEKVSPELRGILRDQARYLATSQLWEIMQATIIQEAADLALMQSLNWEHTLVAKQLHHWGHVFRNLIHTLAKE
jgi:hypothetical protein